MASHHHVCPGNEAGDATTCASLSLGDRGLGSAMAPSAAEVAGTTTFDNVTRVIIVQGTTAGTFDLVTGDGTASGVTAGDDNVTAYQPITDTKNTFTPVALGTAVTVATESVVVAAKPLAGFRSGIMDSDLLGSTLYTLTSKDNGTLYTCTSGTCTTAATGIFATGAVDGATDIDSQIVVDSDGTNIIGIADNSTNLAVYNLTTAATPVRVGVNISTSQASDGFCGAVGGGRVVVANDNSTLLVPQDTITVNSTAIDNTTGWDFATLLQNKIDNSTARGHDIGNCVMTYGGLTSLANSDSAQTFFMLIDNNTTTALYSIVDNQTLALSSATHTGALTVTFIGTVSASTAENMAITADTTNSWPYIAIDNKTGGVSLWRAPLLDNGSYQIEYLGSPGMYGPVSIEVNSDNSKVGVAGIYTDAAAGYPDVRIFYTE